MSVFPAEWHERIKIEKLSGRKNGYYRSHETMERPFAVNVDGLFLRATDGHIRRFADSGAARRAGLAAILQMESP